MKIEERPEVIELPDEAGAPSSPRPELKEVPAPAPARRSPRRWVGIGLMVFAALVALFLVFEFGLSALSAARSQTILLKQFQSLSDQGVATTLDWQPAEGQPIGILSIARIGLQQVVVQGTSSSQTARGPGHFIGSPLPGRPGNSVIAGRRTSYGKAFHGLDQLQKGDQIQVVTGVGTFTYTVTGLSTVHPNDQDVLGPTTDNRLTLITSDPAYRATGRLVATASLVGLPAPAPVVAPVVIPQDQVGLTGEPWAFAPLMLWLELLAVAIVGALWFRRKISARVAWLLAVPLSIGLLWAIFSAMSRLLPATL
jgi:sortase A